MAANAKEDDHDDTAHEVDRRRRPLGSCQGARPRGRWQVLVFGAHDRRVLSAVVQGAPDDVDLLAEAAGVRRAYVQALMDEAQEIEERYF